MAPLLGAALLVLGIIVAGGSSYLQGEVAAACSTNQGQVGQLIGDPDAAACQSYPPMLSIALVAGLAVGVVGVLLALRGR